MKFNPWRRITRIRWSDGNCRCDGWIGERTEDFHDRSNANSTIQVPSLLNAALTEVKVRHDEQPLAERDLMR